MDISYHELRLFWSPQWSWSYCSCWSSPPLPDTLTLSMFDWLLPDLPDNNISFSSLSDWVGSILSSRPSLQVFFESSRSPWDRYNPDDPRPCPRSPPTLSHGMDSFLADWSHFARVREDTPDPSHTQQLPLSSHSHKTFKGGSWQIQKNHWFKTQSHLENLKKIEKYNSNPARRLSSSFA